MDERDRLFLADLFHAAVRAAADLVAARHDQHPGRARRVVERRDQRLALAGDRDQPPHVAIHPAMSVIRASAAGRISRTPGSSPAASEV